MRTLLATLLCVCIFLGFCYVVIETVTPQIVAKLETDILQQLSQHQMQFIEVSIDGRDVTLSGEIDTQEHINQAIKIVSHRPGVRVVMNKMTIVEK